MIDQLRPLVNCKHNKKISLDSVQEVQSPQSDSFCKRKFCGICLIRAVFFCKSSIVTAVKKMNLVANEYSHSDGRFFYEIESKLANLQIKLLKI